MATAAAAAASARAVANSALAHVPRYGFTIDAIRVSSLGGNGGGGEGVESLFPGPPGAETSAMRRLLEAHDAASLASMAESPSLKSSSGNDAQLNDDETAYRRAVSLVELRLRRSFDVRAGLPDALASLLISGRVPNPSPLFQRSGRIADEALRLATWKGDYSMDWYTTRLRLAQSFLLAELHMLAPNRPSTVDDVEEGGEETLKGSTELLRRLAYLRLPLSGPTIGEAQTMEEALKSTKQLVTWGSRGWLGIFRSMGL